MGVDNAVGLVLSLLIAAYLVVAVLFPEQI
jgi:K+-transporting ATPase KdpF subunit